jgi:hypothetical protein
MVCPSFAEMLKEQTKIKLGSHKAFVRGLAAFLLLFAFADMAFPQVFCREELGGLLNLRSAAGSKDNNASCVKAESAIAINHTDDSQSDDPSREVPHEEDCFCCCAHVLAGISFQPNVPGAVRSFPFVPYPDSIPNPPLHGTDHPPRIA